MIIEQNYRVNLVNYRCGKCHQYWAAEENADASCPCCAMREQMQVLEKVAQWHRQRMHLENVNRSLRGVITRLKGA